MTVKDVKKDPATLTMVVTAESPLPSSGYGSCGPTPASSLVGGARRPTPPSWSTTTWFPVGR